MTFVAGAAALSGCGGGGGSNNNVQIRAVDASANGGGQGFLGVTSYQGQAGGPSSVAFSLSAASGTTYPTLMQNFLAANFYSLVLVGRPDVASPTDPRYPTVIPIQDVFSSSYTSQAAVRLVYAAPDAGPVDVLMNGAVGRRRRRRDIQGRQ